jgi:hypothetical protein
MTALDMWISDDAKKLSRLKIFESLWAKSKLDWEDETKRAENISPNNACSTLGNDEMDFEYEAKDGHEDVLSRNNTVEYGQINLSASFVSQRKVGLSPEEMEVLTLSRAVAKARETKQRDRFRRGEPFGKTLSKLRRLLRRAEARAATKAVKDTTKSETIKLSSLAGINTEDYCLMI